MTKIILSIDEELLRKVKKIALRQNTSLSTLVGQSMVQIIYHDDDRKQKLVNQLETFHKQSDLSYGDRDWDRDKLHER